MNTLSTGEEFVSFKGKMSFKYPNWTYLYEADVFLQFRVLSRILELISVSNLSRDSFILIKLNTLSTGEELLTSRGNRISCILIAMVSLISYDISPAGSRFTFLRLIYISLFFFIFCFILLKIFKNNEDFCTN